MLTGEVKWFNVKKGYGFITSNNVDYFVHYADIDCDGFKILKPKQNVEFDTYEGKNGIQAGHVKVVS